LVEYSLVEFKPAQFTIDEIVFIREIRSHMEAATSAIRWLCCTHESHTISKRKPEHSQESCHLGTQAV
jgi:hypothetical protein